MQFLGGRLDVCTPGVFPLHPETRKLGSLLHGTGSAVIGKTEEVVLRRQGSPTHFSIKTMKIGVHLWQCPGHSDLTFNNA